MTDFLDDLNIVAIPSTQAPPQLGIKKKKKNNKYERRRQKAKKAQDQKQNDRTDDGEDMSEKHEDVPADTTNSINESPDTQTSDEEKIISPSDEKYTKPTTANDNERKTIVSASSLQITASSATISPDDNRRTNKNQSKPKKDDSSTNAQKSSPKRNDREDVNNTTIVSISNRNNGESTSDTPLSSKTTNLSATQMQDEEERAKYMAEFHARPMELDRRSGARSTTVVSKNSTHLFTDDVENNSWESLNIYPRLVQTLQSEAFGNLQKPTTIQSNTIRAFQESTSAMMKEDSESKSSSKKIRKKNILVHAETGSGKTLAYLIPVLQSLSFGNRDDINYSTEKPRKVSRSEMGCRCIILCPTRELASQTLQVLERLCQANFPGWIVPGGLLGGDSRKSEKASLRKGLAIIVATPGRLLDHLHKTQSLALSLKGKLKWIVLDEADRLLDMGLGDQVRQIVQWIWANEACSSHQQPWWRSVLVSATVTQSVQALAKERILCGNQEWIWVKGESKAEKMKRMVQKRNTGNDGINATGNDNNDADGYADSTPRQLEQFHITVTAKLRLSTLVAFLVQRISKGERTVVFMATCASVDFHYQLFNAIEDSLWDDDNNMEGEDDTSTAVGLFGRKSRVFKLHGSVSHSKRIQTMKEFNAKTTTESQKSQSRADILLTTDVSARGLNLKGVDWTVQYDPPCEISDYVHRVGRVARAGKAGHSLLFLLPSERKYIEVLKTKGINSLTPISLSSLLNQAAGVCKELTQEGSRQQGEGRGGPTKNDRHSGYARNSRSGEHFSAEVQRRMEDCVVKDDAETRKAFKESSSKRKQKQRKRKLVNSSKDGRKEGVLLEQARAAFLSFLRAYSTKKEPIVRSIFSSRALHFGHIAKSFALKEPPKSLVSKQKKQREQQEGKLKDDQANLPRSLEFGKSSLDLEELLGDEKDDRNKHTKGYDDDDDMEFRSNKRKKIKHNGKSLNAKSLLLENATKMQNNLMDAM